MKNYDVIHFLDVAAYVKTNPLSKKKVLYTLNKLRSTSKKKNTKKVLTEKGIIIYTIKIDEYRIRIRIPSEYEEINKKYIKELDSWVKADRENTLKELKRALLIAVASTTITSVVYEPAKEGLKNALEQIEDLLTDEVGALEDELLIHSGHAYTPDGRKVSPFLPHKCIFGEDKSLTIPDRISEYLEANGLEYLEEPALDKYMLLSEGQVEFAKLIDLKKLEQEHKEYQKSKKNN